MADKGKARVLSENELKGVASSRLAPNTRRGTSHCYTYCSIWGREPRRWWQSESSMGSIRKGF